ncbi:MAG: NlpC/P60 family protein [Acidimicrobiales bacterium]
MTDVERRVRPATTRHRPSSLGTRWILALLGLATVATASVAVAPAPVGASNLSTDQAKAKALYNQIQSMNARVDTLGQRYDLAQIKLRAITHEIANTRVIVRQIERDMRRGNDQLRHDAVFAYVTNGAAAASNPLFNARASTIGSTNVYSQLAQGNIATTLAGLKSSKIRLTQERSLLNAEENQAAAAAAAAARAFHAAQGLQAALQHALAQVKGAIASYIAAQEAAAARRAAGRIHRSHPGNDYPAPPANSRANIAIRAALSYLGVPYVWGGASRSGVDCSGLVMLAYAAAGIFFPHYSGAMFADTVRVPLWDLRPGDLLFYGWRGDQHVAMYLGHHQMIEAETYGTRVHVTPLRLGWGFAGAGRPRV